jgi:peptidoglycan/LPS O-acetylase OafA/YrhL
VGTGWHAGGSGQLRGWHAGTGGTAAGVRQRVAGVAALQVQTRPGVADDRQDGTRSAEDPSRGGHHPEPRLREQTEQTEPTGDGPPTRIAGLDGLRATAVLAVMGFHFGVRALPGGFLGVDLFFVLSGYLITTLLLAEHRRAGRVRLRAFWARRARRLLPCLVLVVAATCLYVRFVAPPGAYPELRLEALSALAFVSNWYQIAASTHYFVDTGVRSPLTQTWTLAIEEQFYLFWPVVTVVVLRLVRRRQRAVVALGSLATLGALASATEMAVRFRPHAATTRLYFGTDTDAQSLLVGVALACVLASSPRLLDRTAALAPRARRAASRWAITAVGTAGLGALAVLVHSVDGQSAFLYRGGFLVVGVAAAGLVGAVVLVPRGPLAWVLERRPLRWIGTISYGLYLWHVPLLLLLSPARTGLSGAGLDALRLGASLAVAAASYLLVERPVLRRTFWRTARSLVPGAAAVGTTVAVLLLTTAPAQAAAPARHFVAVRRSVPPPPEVVVLGDSTALTLGYALSATAPIGTRVVDGGLYGCGLAIATAASATLGATGLPMAPACNSATPRDERWPALDERLVATTRPGDQVLFLAGHWETQFLLVHGRWRDLAQPGFRRDEVRRLDRLVALGTAHGAHVDLLTMPCMDQDFPYGTPLAPSDTPRQRARYNGLLELVARQHPHAVSVIPYGSILCPSGTFTEQLDGVQVRTADGVHTPAYVPGNVYAGNATKAVAERFYAWLAPRLWPLVIAPPPVPTAPRLTAPRLTAGTPEAGRRRSASPP